MINALPVIGWFIDLVASMSLAVPFYFIWNRLAPVYFYWLPEVYKQLPFWDTVGLFIVIPIAKGILLPRVNVSQTNNNK